MKQVLTALLFSIVAAAGNATFVFGQKKSIPHENPFIFLTYAIILCALLLVIASLFYPLPTFKDYLNSNAKAGLITGCGLFITYMGFYFLYSRFGASYYIIYAVISIATTSILVGVVILKEAFNIYYILSICSAILTIVLFFAGQHRPK